MYVEISQLKKYTLYLINRQIWNFFSHAQFRSSALCLTALRAKSSGILATVDRAEITLPRFLFFAIPADKFLATPMTPALRRNRSARVLPHRPAPPPLRG